MAIPGLRFLACASRWFDAATVARVFEPLIADWQREWIDASPSQRARIRVRGTVAFVIAALALAPRALLRTPTAPAFTRRPLSRALIFTTVVASLLTIPIMMETRQMTALETLIASLFVLPSGIAIAFPFSMLWAADAIRRSAVATAAERMAALRFGIIASTLFIERALALPPGSTMWMPLAVLIAMGAIRRSVTQRLAA